MVIAALCYHKQYPLKGIDIIRNVARDKREVHPTSKFLQVKHIKTVWNERKGLLSNA